MVLLELDLFRILVLVNIIFGLIVFFRAISIIIRFHGNLKRAFIFLTLILIILTVGSFLRLFDLVPLAYTESVNLIMNFLIILLIFFSLFNIRRTVNGIDNHYNHDMEKRHAR